MASGPVIPRVSLLLATTLALARFAVATPGAMADREVTVAEGDTLTAIALQYYGDASLAPQIAAYNHLTSADHLTAGEVLQIPDRLGQPPTLVSVAAARAAGAAEFPVVATVSAAPRAGPVIQTGLATWYGPGFEGQVTRCGEVFHAFDLTASSNDLPCGTVIQVTDVDDGRSVIVTVDDTGNFQHPTILDLSEGAFSSLAPTGAGVLDVSIAPVLPGTPP